MSDQSNDTLVRVSDLTRSFPVGDGVLEVLKGVNFEIKRGEIMGIVGSSGSGKSTLLHILGALDKPTSGSVYFNETDLFTMAERKITRFRNKSIGFVFQFHHLLSEFTAIENVMIPGLINGRKKEELRGEARDLLTEVGLGERLDHKPGKLSGGEQQRVALARALINRPELILADEPTGNLDSKTGDAVHDLLKKMNKERGLTFVIVTHNPDLVAISDRFIRVADGRIVY